MEERKKIGTVLIRVWGWIRGQFVQDVPEGIVLCEFDCRKEQCVIGEWQPATGVCTRLRVSFCHILPIPPRKTNRPSKRVWCLRRRGVRVLQDNLQNPLFSA